MKTDAPKKPLAPMPIRDRGGTFKIENPNDSTPISEMFTLADGLIFVTGKCTYKLQVADQIDPDRTNPELPHNIHQRLFDYGTESDLFRRTLLQSKVLFRKEFLSIDIDRALQLGFNALCEMVALHEEADAFVAAEQTETAKMEADKRTGMGMSIPAVQNIRAHCKTFIQKADHFAEAMHDIVKLFYPNAGNWTDFWKLVATTYGADDPFCKMLQMYAPFLRLVRNGRDCLEHAHLQGATTWDFELQADGRITPPTIAINFRKSVLDRCLVSHFMKQVEEGLLDCFELMIAQLAGKECRPFADMPMCVGMLSDEYQKAWHVRFAYGTYFQDGRFAPCG
jgi:hypothetical protein